jgi:hypothetical protein
MICEIVTIKTKNGPVDINKSDFDEKKHKIHIEKHQKPAKNNKKAGK